MAAIVSVVVASAFAFPDATAAETSVPQAWLGPDGRMTFLDPAWVPLVENPSSEAKDLGLTEIYSNFNVRKGILYDPYHSHTLMGPDAGFSLVQWLGMPFTPERDAVVVKIQLALELFRGTDRLSVSLRDDADGVPGRAMRTFKISHVRAVGSCCDVEAVAPGVPVEASRVYWVDVRANADTWAGWNLNSIYATGVIAYNNGNGWMTFDTLPGAFRVMGVQSSKPRHPD